MVKTDMLVDLMPPEVTIILPFDAMLKAPSLKSSSMLKMRSASLQVVALTSPMILAELVMLASMSKL